MNVEPTLLRAVLALTLLGLLFFVIERGLGRGRTQPFFRRGWATDVLYGFFTILLTKPLVRLTLILPAAVLILAQLTTPELLKLQAYRGYGPLSRQPVWLQAVQIYVLVDLIGYWVHRLFHRGRWWPFHAVHHSSEDLDWLGSLRVHPVNELVNKLAQATPVLLLGYNPTVTLSTAPLLTLYAVFLHANVNWDFGPLRTVLATPVFHRWHHSKDREAWDKNFAGLFPVWDLLFGTYYMPKGRWPENFGICEPMPSHFLGQLWSPFAALFHRARRSQPDDPQPPA
ncbi:MAG TPA: sterol desaturase family protein [Opitutaceae bacterium]|nr:sterol desaturase family protein [Opitutaceae bacterium]HRE04356.1 sterol desaturase family protein [Opitutaceae bacterium]